MMFDLNIMSESSEVERLATFVCGDIEYDSRTAIKNMKVVLCNLYASYMESKEHYLAISLDDRTYLKGRYNPSGFGIHPVGKIVRALRDHDYIDYQGRFWNPDFSTGYCTRIRSKEKLALLFGQYGLRPGMLQDHPYKEVLLLKEESRKETVYHKGLDGVIHKRKANLAKLTDYLETKERKGLRGIIRRYNELLKRTHIDVDEEGFVPSKERKDDIVINPANRETRRIFNGDFRKGGRFYGGWWQLIPSDLRKRIMINGRHVVEIDYAGMHIHILYAMKGLKLRDFNRLPYIVAKDNDPEQLRPFYKKLLLIAMNCDKDRKCLYLVGKDMRDNPENYPFTVEKKKRFKFLKGLLKAIRNYHPEIGDLLNTGKGIEAQYYDSQIASYVINKMTNKKIPVLCVHDSFICEHVHRNTLLNVMIEGFIKVANNVSTKKHSIKKVKLTRDDVATDMSTLIELPNDTWNTTLAINTINRIGAGFTILPMLPKQSNDTLGKGKLFIPLYKTYLKEHLTCNVLLADNKYIQRYKRYLSDGGNASNAVIVIKSLRDNNQ